MREEIDGLYAWFDNITQHLAWNPDWYETVQSVHADAKDVPYDQAFYDAVNSFSATWPSLMREPDSEKIKVDEVQQKSTESMFTMLEPVLSPMNKARLVQWVQDNANARKLLFPVQLDLDIEEQEDYAPPEQELAESGEDKEPRPPKAFKDSDSVWTEAAE